MKSFKMKQMITALVLAVAIAVMLPLTCTTTVQAGVKKANANKNYQSAPNLKIGTNIVTDKKNSSYVRFTAPSAGKYVFTISDMSVAKKPSNRALCNIYFQKLSGIYSKYLSNVDVKTQGGKTTCSHTATKNYGTVYSNASMKKIDQYLKTRSMTLQLNAGESVWIQTYSTAGSLKYTMKIKRK